jgi:hypothetical protein
MSKKFKFKKGDRVIVSSIHCHSEGDEKATVIELRDRDYVVEFDKPGLGWSDEDYNTSNGWYVSEEGLSYADGKYITVSKSEMRKIYDIACDAWKKKIEDLFDNVWSESVELREDFCKLMIKSSTDSQKPIVEKVLFDSGYKVKGKEYMCFGESYSISTSSANDGLFVRYGIANEGFEYMEVGLSQGCTIELYDKDGECFSLTAQSQRDVYFRIKQSK